MIVASNQKEKTGFCRFPVAGSWPGSEKAVCHWKRMYIEKGEPYALYHDFGGQESQP